MRNLPILIGREMRSLFVSPILWIVMVMFLIFNGLSFWVLLYFLSQPMAPEGAPMQFFFGGWMLYWVVVMPMSAVIPMGSIAGEARNGTLETLLTAPVTELEVIYSKFLASWLFYTLLWLPTLVYVALLYHYADPDPDPGPIAAGYLGTLLLGGAYLSIGILMSTLTKNQIIAAVLTFAAILVLFLISLASYLPLASISDVLGYMNIYDRMEEWGRGTVDTRLVAYCLSIMIFSLFCSIRVLESRRWR